MSSVYELVGPLAPFGVPNTSISFLCTPSDRDDSYPAGSRS